MHRLVENSVFVDESGLQDSHRSVDGSPFVRQLRVQSGKVFLEFLLEQSNGSGKKACTLVQEPLF